MSVDYSEESLKEDAGALELQSSLTIWIDYLEESPKQIIRGQIALELQKRSKLLWLGNPQSYKTFVAWQSTKFLWNLWSFFLLITSFWWYLMKYQLLFEINDCNW